MILPYLSTPAARQEWCTSAIQWMVQRELSDLLAPCPWSTHSPLWGLYARSQAADHGLRRAWSRPRQRDKEGTGWADKSNHTRNLTALWRRAKTSAWRRDCTPSFPK